MTEEIFDSDPLIPNPDELKNIPKFSYKRQIVWRNVVLMGALHLAAIYGFYLLFAEAMRKTIIFTITLYFLSGWGITAGAHRLWAHRSFKAKNPLKLILMVLNTLAFQNDVIEWSRDHRVHHRYSETDADPHNALRGLFFSHIGWLLVRKHPAVIEKGKKVDISDLTADPILMFQRRHYKLLVLLLSFVLPTVVPWYFWGESLRVAYFTAALFRYAFTLNITWMVNSLSHFYGSHPYDKGINPSQNFTTILLSVGEGWHNYHHVFPYDYRASEYPWRFNPTSWFIDFFAWIGWAYDLKTVSPEGIQKKKDRSGEKYTGRMKYVYG